MRVLRLEAENVKRLRAVDIAPKGNMVTISGANGAGKSSLLDAIWMAMQGKKAMPERTVRKGAEKAKIQLTLGTGDTVELLVCRTINSKGATTLEVYPGMSTKPMERPQEVLDALYGMMSFDPLRFMNLSLKEQITELRMMVPLSVDVDALNAANKVDYDERTDVKREVKRLSAEADLITVQSGAPAAKIDEQAIREKLAAAAAQNDSMAGVIRERERLAGAISREQNRAEDERKEIARLERLLAASRKALRDAVMQLDASKEQLGGIPEPATVNIAELTTELEQARIANREIDKRERRADLMRRAADAERNASRLTRAMEDREEAKRNALAEAKIPVAGLTFDEATILYEGIPLSQISTAEQIRVCVGLSMAANPKLRVVPIRQGNLLDSASLEMIDQMAAENDYQVWMEWVDSSGKVGIVIEDGMVKATNVL
jgi:DNA repair exonuclease SbcCD ATPase subunit